jgi:two-component system, NtrC family, sensor kinase
MRIAKTPETPVPEGVDGAPAPAGLSAASRPVRETPPAGEPPRVRFGTRGRLVAAFSALAGVFVLASLSQLAGLARIDRQLTEVAEHDEQMRLTLELENAVRSAFSHQAHFVVGDHAHLSGYRDARAEGVQLFAALKRSLDEPQALRRLADAAATDEEFDRNFQEKIVPAVLNRELGVMLTHDKTYALVNKIEHDLDAILALLHDEVADQHAEVTKQGRRTLLFAIVFLVGTPLFALGLAAYLSRSIARPLAVLGDGAARVAGGDLDTRIDLRTRDEFGALARKFNDMTVALKEHQEKLVRSEKLVSLGRMAAGIAHELNDPLQVMLGYLSLDKHRVKGELGRHFAAIEKEALRCKEIVESVLHLSRPAAAVPREPVDLREVALEVATSLQMSLGESAPSLAVEGEGAALGSRTRLHQIAYVLARNAAEAAGPQGEVRISVAADGAWAELSVSDSGPGVPPELRDQIFEPFYTTKSDGLGLGLSIARAIAHGLGGDIELAEAPGGGARFMVRLPRARGGGA